MLNKYIMVDQSPEAAQPKYPGEVFPAERFNDGVETTILARWEIGELRKPIWLTRDENSSGFRRMVDFLSQQMDVPPPDGSELFCRPILMIARENKMLVVDARDQKVSVFGLEGGPGERKVKRAAVLDKNAAAPILETDDTVLFGWVIQGNLHQDKNRPRRQGTPMHEAYRAVTDMIDAHKQKRGRIWRIFGLAALTGE
jgi:hypothetical protein